MALSGNKNVPQGTAEKVAKQRRKIREYNSRINASHKTIADSEEEIRICEEMIPVFNNIVRNRAERD